MTPEEYAKKHYKNSEISTLHGTAFGGGLIQPQDYLKCGFTNGVHYSVMLPICQARFKLEI